MSKRSAEVTKQSSLSSFFQPQKRTKIAAASTQESIGQDDSYIIYCDLDGVLVDFEAGVKRLFPKSENVSEIPSRLLWPKLAQTKGFFSHLPWMSDGKQLWKTLLQTIQKPVEKEETKASSFQSTMQLRILTGCPMFHAAAHDKYQWCTRELGFATLHIPKTGPKHQQRDPLKQCHNKIQIVTCRSKEKHLQSGRNCILIDDRLDLQAAWEQKGGIFIHHTSTATTLQQLQDKGILTAETIATINENGNNADENVKPSAAEQKPVVMYPEDEEPGTDDEEY